jgi:hypothetical protein
LDGNMVSPVMGFPLISHAATLLPVPSLISHDCGVTRGICYVQCKYEIQWSKEKVQKDKQRSTKHTNKTKDRVTRTPLKTGGGLNGVSSNLTCCHITTSSIVDKP